MPSADESRLHSLERLLAEARERDAAEARRRAEEDERRRLAEAKGPGYSTEDLERMVVELRASLDQREHHLRTTAQRELLQGRAGRLADEIKGLREKIAAAEAERAALVARIG